VAKIHKYDMYLSTVVGIHSPGRVEHRYSMTYGEARTWPDLSFNSRRQRDGDAGRDHGAVPWRYDDRDIGRHRGHEVKPGGELALVGRERKVAGVR
jgi:hypothetical protein